jgi:hypothetical protein
LLALIWKKIFLPFWPEKRDKTRTVLLRAKKLSQKTPCHSERSEESLISAAQTLRFAQGDSFETVSKRDRAVNWRISRLVNWKSGLFSILSRLYSQAEFRTFVGNSHFTNRVISYNIWLEDAKRGRFDATIWKIQFAKD